MITITLPIGSEKKTASKESKNVSPISDYFSDFLTHQNSRNTLNDQNIENTENMEDIENDEDIQNIRNMRGDKKMKRMKNMKNAKRMSMKYVRGESVIDKAAMCDLGAGCEQFNKCSGNGICQQGRCLCDALAWGSNCSATEFGTHCDKVRSKFILFQ